MCDPEAFDALSKTPESTRKGECGVFGGMIRIERRVRSGGRDASDARRDDAATETGLTRVETGS
ncbi:protein of unknown function [Pararobbsia alpina]